MDAIYNRIILHYIVCPYLIQKSVCKFQNICITRGNTIKNIPHSRIQTSNLTLVMAIEQYANTLSHNPVTSLVFDSSLLLLYYFTLLDIIFLPVHRNILPPPAPTKPSSLHVTTTCYINVERTGLFALRRSTIKYFPVYTFISV